MTNTQFIQLTLGIFFSIEFFSVELQTCERELISHWSGLQNIFDMNNSDIKKAVINMLTSISF